MSNIKIIKRQLLQETNYRCGYCMKNITPKMYYIDEEPTNQQPLFDYLYYNIHDRAHIEPNSEVNDNFKDFYNLIALCKQCHWEIDKTKMLTTTELKRQKLYWMIASGKFTRLEIDLLFDLYFCQESADKGNPKNDSQIKNIHRKLKIAQNKKGDDIYSEERHQGGSIAFINNGKTAIFHYPRMLSCLFSNIESEEFIEVNVLSLDANFGIALAKRIDNERYVLTIDKPTPLNPIREIFYAKITDKGKAFCKKFSDIYPDL